MMRLYVRRTFGEAAAGIAEGDFGVGGAWFTAPVPLRLLVAQALPERRRDEITRELRANILDSLESIREQQEREPTAGEVAAVLVALGHPQQVAASFLPPQQLVTADLFPLYKQSLHYGVILVFILGLIQFSISFLNSGHMDFIGLFHGLVMKGLITFAVITGLFLHIQ